MIHRLLLIALISVAPFGLSAQDRLPHANLNSEFQPSPNAAQPGTQETIGVDYYTGAAQVSVPLFSFSSGATGLNHSISLNYRGGGIRPDDVASNTGLGWSCNAAINVSRVIKGLPDDATSGYHSYGTASPLDKIVDNTRDHGPDLFSFSTGRSSGQFIIGSSGVVLTIPRSNVKIEFLSAPYSTSSAALDSCVGTQFKITDLDGTQYYYADFNCTRLDFGDSSSSRIYYNSTTWYITKIVSSFDKDSILFAYDPVVQTYSEGESQTSYALKVSDAPLVYDDNRMTTSFTGRLRDRRLTGIDYPDGTHATFTYQSYGRLDFNSDKALKSITISNGNSSYGYDFEYAYSGGITQWMTDQDYSTTQYWGKDGFYRLYLKGLKKVSGSESLPGYVFDYLSPIMPARGQGQIDHWRFLSNSAGDRIPAMYVPGSPSAILSGGSRAPDLDGTRGSLYKITNPMGGVSEFQYELNTAYVSGLLYPNFDFISFGTDTSIAFNRRNIRTYSLDASTSTLTNELAIYPQSWPSSFSTTNDRIGIVVYAKDAGGVPTASNTVFEAEFDFSDFSQHNGLNQTFSSNSSDTFVYQLYTVPSRSNYNGINNSLFKIDWTRSLNGDLTTPAIQDQSIGGIRVKKIVTSDGLNASANDQVRELEYTLEDGHSSGVLGNLPKYGFDYTETYTPNPINHHRPASAPASGMYESYNLVGSYTGDIMEEASVYNYIVRTESPVNEIIYTHGSPVGYKRVIEYIGPKTKFKNKKIYEFTTLQDPNLDIVPEAISLPYPPKPVLDFAAGLPVKVSEYIQSGILSRKTLTEYNVYPEYKDGIGFGSKRVIQRIHPTTLASPYYVADYYPLTGKVFPAKSTHTEYFVNSDSMQKVTEMDFDTAHMVARSTSSTDAVGRTVFTKQYYPFDFSVSGAIGTLNSKGIIYSPIRTEAWRENNNGAELLNAAVSSFQITNSNAVRQEASYLLAPAAPITASSYGAFSPFILMPSGQPFTKLAQMDQYDSKGNVIQTTVKGTVTSTIWDYHQSYPVARIINAQVEDVAYTSFESDGSGSWVAANLFGLMYSSTGGFTGSNCVQLSSPSYFRKDGLDASKSYIVSCWAKGAPAFNGVAGTPSDTHRGWTLYKATITGTSTISVSCSLPTGIFIDELRLYPVGSVMSTSTYDPLFGVTSSCDASNRTTYFEYDTFGRLQYQRDMDGNIQRFQEYKNQDPQ